ncbi:glycoside hydrolase family 32 protein [Oerskovia flava]|uniref:glycoside hydrolase family 32 protein n=1 Tax=Oerskovia flava TaxID=2986422 RepID=UPI00223F7109|nr:glycoside hydrolase family 32 protein [Oerskovia sp. JB1-3-2]
MSTQTFDQALQAADDHIANTAIAPSRWRPAYHLTPPTGWMNDPNGFVQYEGRYHLFYQFWPYGPEWGPMHWGHAVSDDLVRWEHLPTALAPSEEYDSGDGVPGYGCFSGSALVDRDGRLVLMYTGHVDGRQPPQTQNIAISTDGVHFHKSAANPVIPAPPVDGGPDFRDPTMAQIGDRTYAVIGSSAAGRGKALLFATDGDLETWEYVGVAAESTGQEGTMWECPDLFPLADRFALVVSPMQGTLNTFPFIQIGDFQPDSGRFTSDRHYQLDGGIDFYAPQTLVDDTGRRILIGWMQQWFQRNVTAADGWSGAMSIPRELTLDAGVLRQRPVTEIESLRGPARHLGAHEVGTQPLMSDTGASAEVRIVLGPSTAPVARIAVRASSDESEQTVYTVDRRAGRIVCDRSLSGAGDVTSSHVTFDPARESLELRFFIDTCSVELFVDDGAAVMTNRIYPNPDSTGLTITAVGVGTLNVEDFTVWPLSTRQEPSQ